MTYTHTPDSGTPGGIEEGNVQNPTVAHRSEALSRRALLAWGAAMNASAALLVSGRRATAKPVPQIRAVAFDGFTVLDPRSVTVVAEKAFPGRGAELVNAWRTRQFEYTWLRTLSGSYVDFWHVTEDALVFTGKLLKLDLTSQKRATLMDAFLHFPAWPDAVEALQQLKSNGIRLAFLSNFSKAMLDAAVVSAGLQNLFDPHLSTDMVRAYKPDPRAYRMALKAFGLKRDEIAFAAFGGWDAAGAKAFGYPTFWVNRFSLPAEELSAPPDAVGTSLVDLVAFVLKSR